MFFQFTSNSSFHSSANIAERRASAGEPIPYRDIHQEKLQVTPWGRREGWGGLRQGFVRRAAHEVEGCGVRTRRIQTWDSLSASLRARLQHLKTLTAGWDGDDATPVSSAAIAEAEGVLESLASSFLNFKEPVLVPKYDGYVQLEWHSSHRTLEFELLESRWEVMGSTRHGAETSYLTGCVAVGDLSALEQCYRWWAEGRLVWPLP